MCSFKFLRRGFKNRVSGRIIVISCITFLALPFTAHGVAHAQTLNGQDGQNLNVQTPRVAYDRALMTRLPSSTEDVGIAFLKMANTFPDFSKIVEESDTYKNLNPLAQQDFKVKTVNKLQTSYLNFQPKKSDLIIRVKVNVLFNKLANGEGVLKIRTFPTDPVYFPFYFAKYPIALVIKDMEVFREMHLDKADTDIIYNRLSLSGDATMLLQVYPVAVDDKKTVTLDHIPQYPMLAEIGYIGLINARAEQIWAWRNDKFGGKKSGTSNSQNLIDLFPADKTVTQQPVTQ